MRRDQDKGDQFEWVNAWAASIKAEAPAIASPEPAVTRADQPVAAPADRAPPGPVPDDQLARDIAEIKRKRDTLAALPLGTFSLPRNTQALTLVPSRRSDPVPVVIGGVLALVMLTVFGAAAAMTRFSR